MTPQEVATLLENLSLAFQNQDSRSLQEQFSTRPDTTYAGSEADEIAHGPEGIKTLFDELLNREEAYSFVFRTPHVVDMPAGCWIIAEGTGTEHGPSGERQTFAYRVTGLIVRERDRPVWLALCGSEVIPPASESDSSQIRG